MAQTTRERYVAPQHSSGIAQETRAPQVSLDWEPWLPPLWTWATDDQVGNITQCRTKLTSSATPGSPPCDRHRDPTIHTRVGHVTNAEPDIRCTRRNRGIGRPDEVHLQRHGPCYTCNHQTRHHPPTDRFLSSSYPWRRRRWWPSNERAPQLAREACGDSGPRLHL
jgi:hypothetical protein